jgi:hypothetical protein
VAGLVPAIHVFASAQSRTWMPGTRPGMTEDELIAQTVSQISSAL